MKEQRYYIILGPIFSATQYSEALAALMTIGLDKRQSMGLLVHCGKFQVDIAYEPGQFKSIVTALEKCGIIVAFTRDERYDTISSGWITPSMIGSPGIAGTTHPSLGSGRPRGKRP